MYIRRRVERQHPNDSGGKQDRLGESEANNRGGGKVSSRVFKLQICSNPFFFQTYYVIHWKFGLKVYVGVAWPRVFQA